MIIYDLRCKKGHKFEGWFKDRENCLLQNSEKLIVCPVCSSSEIEIMPSSVAIRARDSRPNEKNEKNKQVSPAEALKVLNQYIDKNFEDVGDKFAEVALKIHYGDEEKRNIKGTSTPEEEESLKEEGVKFIKIPLLKMDS